MAEILDSAGLNAETRGLRPATTPLVTWLDVNILLVLPVLFLMTYLLREDQFSKVGRSLGRSYGDPPAIRSGLRHYYGDSKNAPAAIDEIAMRATALILEKDMQYVRWSGRRRAPDFLPARLQGQEIIASALGNNKGVVLWVADFIFAAWAAKSAFAEAGWRLWQMTSPQHGVSVSRFGMKVINPICTRVEDRYLAGRIVVDRRNPAAASLRAARRLADNAIVSVTATDWEGARVLHLPVGRGIVPIANGAPAMAHLCGAALIPVVAVRPQPTLPVDVVALEPIEPGRGLSRSAWVDAAARMFSQRVDPFIQRYPEQWRAWHHVRPAGAAGEMA